jgi:peroxiredoxin Q/BCP
MIAVGKRAPDFSLPSTLGKSISLKDYAGKKIVLYFYPKDDTPGCTKEACSFQDHLSSLTRMGAVVLGVSTDSLESHQKFAAKYKLRFPLLSDVSRKVVERYGVWKEKSMYGRTYMGIERTTVLIDASGVIRHIFPKVKVDGHTAEVKQFLKEL